ncbi:hypothetical protein RFI_19776 [Reticulomyxa filosa]|uniref:Uncharacterized protein n=1 Tax=Reticulomyxa filosa TaxID=46433 RepID=X6MVQ7_RETFI|nr:hypothetical protein RFI_19776 [Reticulomyxa filosa]|eukprot:ETO17542.1 hypothetical protein RFI_19776 [Reticulomyxa filosa]
MLSTSMIRDCDIVLFMYDITDHSSFEHIKTRWVPQFIETYSHTYNSYQNEATSTVGEEEDGKQKKTHHRGSLNASKKGSQRYKDVMAFVVGNKLDRNHKRKVTPREAEALCAANNPTETKNKNGLCSPLHDKCNNNNKTNGWIKDCFEISGKDKSDCISLVKHILTLYVQHILDSDNSHNGGSTKPMYHTFQKSGERSDDESFCSNTYIPFFFFFFFYEEGGKSNEIELNGVRRDRGFFSSLSAANMFTYLQLLFFP